MKITEHFTLEELTISSSFPNLVKKNREDAVLVIENITKTANMLEAIRKIFNSPVIVYSCFRNYELNKAVGGVSNSFHQTGRAADIVIKNTKVYDSFLFIKNNSELFKFVGKIIYENINGAEWLHVQLKVKETDTTKLYTKYTKKPYVLVKEF